MESTRSEGTVQGDGVPRSLVGWVGWRTAFLLGLITLVLGVVIAFRPTQSLTAIAVLLGIAAIVSGIYHIARALDAEESDRVWRGISGVLFILTGLVLLRHLHLSVALIGLFIGFTWIIQGVMALMEGFSSRRGRGQTGWTVVFGVISLIAGIVVVSSPIGSVATLTVFMGIWLIIMGIMEMFGALAFRHAVRKADSSGLSVPSQRSDAGGGRAGHRRPDQDVAGQPTAATSRSQNRNTPA